MRALQLGIWNLIDPAQEFDPVEKWHPAAESKTREIARPSPPESLQGDEDSETQQNHLVKWQIYQIHVEQYRAQQRDLGSIADFILQRVSPDWQSRLMYLAEWHHPHEMLRLLRERIAPEDTESFYHQGVVPGSKLMENMPTGPKDPRFHQWLEGCDLLEAKSRRYVEEEWRGWVAAQLGRLDEKWAKENESAVRRWNTQELIDNYRRHWKEMRALDLRMYGRTTMEESW